MAYYNPMTYTPNYFAPQTTPQVQQNTSTPANSLIWVQGESGAKSYLVAPNNTILLMDSESPKFYIKSADASGMPMPLRIFEYNEITGKKTIVEATPDNKYVTREEFDKKIAEIMEKKVSKKEVKADD